MALYKITGPDTSIIEAVIVNAGNDNAALMLATSPGVFPESLRGRVIRDEWRELAAVEYLGTSVPADRPAGVLAVQRPQNR